MCGATACAIMRALGMNTNVCVLQATPVSSGIYAPVIMKSVFSHLRQRTHGERAVSLEGAHQHVDAILIDELHRRCHGGVWIGRIVYFKNHHRPSQHTLVLLNKLTATLAPWIS